MVTFVTFTIDLHNEVTPNKWTMVERGNPEGSAPNPLNYIIDRLLPPTFPLKCNKTPANCIMICLLRCDNISVLVPTPVMSNIAYDC